jgi:2,5-diamino-6-(ribosylamino)-4(3H)-pyrimidinone 5'-phosphate reductase
MTRPYVICHMCSSIDGKIIGSRWPRLPNGKAMGAVFEPTAASFGIGAWIVGTTTMKEFQGRNVKLRPANRPIERGDHLANGKTRNFAIGVDAKGVLRFQKNEVDGDHVLLLVTQQVSDHYLAHLQDAGVSYLFCGKTEVNLATAMDKLRRVVGIRKLMLEGGGKFNGSMLRAGLVDEISQIIVPAVDGGEGVSSIFDISGRTKHAAARLRLTRHRKLPGGLNWLQYRVICQKR